MKTIKVSIAVVLSAAYLPAVAQHGVIAGDINRKGIACSDFFDYANGAWRRNSTGAPISTQPGCRAST